MWKEIDYLKTSGGFESDTKVRLSHSVQQMYPVF
jgi:hypothetical protein